MPPDRGRREAARRSDLIALLNDSLTDTPIHYGVEIERYDRAGDGVSITSAEGIGSVVRAQSAGSDPAHEYG